MERIRHLVAVGLTTPLNALKKAKRLYSFPYSCDTASFQRTISASTSF
jgi:hypothetical protein